MMPALASLSFATEASNDCEYDESAYGTVDADGGTPPAQRAFRDALGQFATGVTVVTAGGADGKPVGVTINSLASVSLAPPLVVWSLARTSASLPSFCAAPCHAINVLASTQEAVCRRFATGGIDRFAGTECRAGPCGTTLIAGALAYFICRHRSVRVVGDHVLFIAEAAYYRSSAGVPLVFRGGGFR
jgi:unspecific monooxygenase